MFLAPVVVQAAVAIPLMTLCPGPVPHLPQSDLEPIPKENILHLHLLPQIPYQRHNHAVQC